MRHSEVERASDFGDMLLVVVAVRTVVRRVKAIACSQRGAGGLPM
jgi:hypothetical protein